MSGGQTNEEDIAAVTEVARSYYEGMIAGDEALLSRAFHPRACIVGNFQGELEWLTLEEFVAECKEGSGAAVGPSVWRLDGLSVEGDTALIRLGGQYAGEWYSDDLSMLRINGSWRIVHKTWFVHASTAESGSGSPAGSPTRSSATAAPASG
jgi:hypothetical protein